MRFNYDAIVKLCTAESERQGEYDPDKLIRAYFVAYSIWALDWSGREPLEMEHIMLLADIIDWRNTDFRIVPVTFADTSHGLHPDLVKDAMWTLIDNQRNMSTDEFVKEFLDIHPFIDGNGRVAFLLYNLLGDTMTDPKQLPDYYGGGNDKK